MYYSYLGERDDYGSIDFVEVIGKAGWKEMLTLTVAYAPDYSNLDYSSFYVNLGGSWELGNDFAFVGRQRRLRIGGEWLRVDLLFFHRRLRCLIVIDLKVGKFTHADAGQMHLYLNYAREHWSQPEENPPVGLILCAQKDEALAKYALEGLPNKVLAREYKLALPDEKTLARELEMTQKRLASRQK